MHTMKIWEQTSIDSYDLLWTLSGSWEGVISVFLQIGRKLNLKLKTDSSLIGFYFMDPANGHAYIMLPDILNPDGRY